MEKKDLEINRLLVIRLSAMGDVAMTVPVLIALTSAYPKLRITVLTKPFFKPIFNSLPNVAVHIADVKGKHKGILGLWRLYRELKALQLDAVVDVHNVLRSKILKFFFALSGVPFYQIDKGRTAKRALTSLKNKLFEPLPTTHERYADVFMRVGFTINLEKKHILPKEALPREVVPLMAVDAVRRIGVAPFAAFKGKMYPADLMEEVLTELNNTNKYNIFLFGGGQEEQKQLQYWEGKLANCISMAGKLTLAKELCLISNLDLMLAMDSGNAHLSAMYGVPTLTMWGVTHPYAGFYPFGQESHFSLLADREKYPLIPTSIYGNRFPPGYENAMRTIVPKNVVAKIDLFLDKDEVIR